LYFIILVRIDTHIHEDTYSREEGKCAHLFHREN